MLTLFRFLSYFPLYLLHGIGSLLGWLVYMASPVYRRRIHENLAQAFPEKSAREVRAIRRTAVGEIGKTIFEIPKLWFRPREEVAARVKQVSGWACVEAALQAGRGIVFITPHLGCFEISARYFSMFAPITALYRSPKKKILQPVIEAGRKQKNLSLAPADFSGVRLLLKALKRGEAVGILPDQSPRFGEGVWADFFGRPAYTMALAGRLADSEAALIYAFAIRLPHARGYHLYFFAPEQPLTGDPVDRANQINRQLETMIRQYPSQYLWSYNRYKQPRGAETPPASQASVTDGNSTS